MEFPSMASVFDIFWNSPLSESCSSQLPLSKYGIIANANGSFFGNRVNLFYGADVATPHYLKNGTAVNGGIPQRGSLAALRGATTELIVRGVTNASYDGLLVLDIESVYPLWDYDFGPLGRERTASIAYTREKYPSLNESEVEAVAREEFNEGMAVFYSAQLATIATLRPRATIGYYRLPHCWYNESAPTDACLPSPRPADSLSWLFGAESGIFPGAYFSSENTTVATQHAIPQIAEAVRVAQAYSGGRARVLPYMSYAYRSGPRWPSLLSREQLWQAFAIPSSLGAHGMVLWGGSDDAAAGDCETLRVALDSWLGSQILELKANLSRCSVANCGGHGRCATHYRPLRETSPERRPATLFLRSTLRPYPTL
jgi:hypothetical protein